MIVLGRNISLQDMKRSVQHSQLWVKLAIGTGILLGLLLLVQTIGTYFFVYDKIVREESVQEVERKEAAIMRAATAAKLVDLHRLGPVLAEVERESPKQVAWIRVISVDSEVLAETGEPNAPIPPSEQLHKQLELHQTRRETAKFAGRDVLIVITRLRLFNPGPGPDGPRFREPRHMPPGPPAFLEMAIYLDGITINFTALRQNLIVGCLAAVALLTSMLMISFLFNRYIQARQLEQQVELARSVQADLLPPPSGWNASDHFEFAAAFLPAAMVGGDFYDVFTSDDGVISVLLGDVAGKGISAALLMGVLHGAIRSMNWTDSAADQVQASHRLNLFLCEKTARERFVSLFWASFSPNTGLLRYVNAGHLPPLLIKAGTNDPLQVDRLEEGGPVLGLLPLAQYNCGEVRVDAGDVLVIFSDGVAEASNAEEDEFGEGRIAEIVRRNRALPPKQICDAILAEVSGFLDGMKPHDDQTLLVVRLAPTATEVSSTLTEASSLLT